MKFTQRLSLLILVALCISLPNNALGKSKASKTSLEIQVIQSREYETTKKTAFNSTLSVFQDLGYIIGSADFNTGFITASSPTQQSNFLSSKLTEETNVSAFIEKVSEESVKVRLNFVNAYEKLGAWSGQRRKLDKPVENPEIYQNAFNKIQETIFIKQALSNDEASKDEQKNESQGQGNGEKSLSTEIDKLFVLKEKGIITEEEFNKAKTKLIENL